MIQKQKCKRKDVAAFFQHHNWIRILRKSVLTWIKTCLRLFIFEPIFCSSHSNLMNYTTINWISVLIIGARLYIGTRLYIGALLYIGACLYIGARLSMLSEKCPCVNKKPLAFVMFWDIRGTLIMQWHFPSCTLIGGEGGVLFLVLRAVLSCQCLFICWLTMFDITVPCNSSSWNWDLDN